MTINPYFSITIPTYNRAVFIRKTIESLLAQTFQSFEIIVVDDGSTDNTEDVVKSIPSDKIRYYKKENAERAAARNFGVKRANGQYISFLDSDDIVYSNHLEVANTFLLTNKNVDIFHLGYDIKDVHGRLLREVRNIKSINSQILSGNILSCNGIFARKDCILKNEFNEDRKLSSLEDWELWIRMSARYNFLNDNTITSSVIQHNDRSVMATDTNKIKEKVHRFVQFVLDDNTNRAHFGSKLKKVVASAWTYAALHLIMANEDRKEVLHYLLKGIRVNPREIFRKRFLVILMKLVSL